MNLKNKKDQNKFILLCVFLAVAIVFLIYYGVKNINSNGYDYLKENKSKKLVYTKQKLESGNYYQYVPYLNIDDDLGTLVNNNIDEYINSFEHNNTSITYEYNVSGKVLSLIIKVEDHSIASSSALLYFNSYNINLEKEELLSSDQIIKYFDTTEEEVETVLNSQIEEYYYELVEDNIVNERTCNYNCFLKSRNYTNNIDDVAYYIKEGKLIAYKPHIFIALSDKDKIKYSFTLTE